MDGVCLAPRGAIEHPLADKPIDAFNGETPPCHARCKNKATRPDNIDPVEENLVLCWIDARDRPRYQNFSPQPPCLLKGTTRKLVAGYATRKAEVILDARRRSGLSAGRLSLDYDGAKPFGRPVDRRGKASRPTTDNRNINWLAEKSGALWIARSALRVRLRYRQPIAPRGHQ